MLEAYLSFLYHYSTTTLKRPSIKNAQASYFKARAFLFYGPVTKFQVTAALYCCPLVPWLAGTSNLMFSNVKSSW